MSRRARLEEERQKQLNQELEEEENRIKAQRERIYAPIVWKRLGSGIRIQDLKPDYYERVLEIIRECYFQEEVLCRNTNICQDDESVKCYLNMVTYLLNDRTSIIALDEVNEEAIAGFLVLKVFHQDDFSSVFTRVLPVQGEAMKKIVEFRNYLSRKSDVCTEFNCTSFLQYCILCICPEYRKKGLGLQLFLAALDVARSLDVPVVMGLFSSFTLQKLGKRVGMKIINEIFYTSWKDRFHMVFPEPGIGNFTYAAMAGVVPPPPKLELPPVEEVVEEKVTREQKRKEKNKKKK